MSKVKGVIGSFGSISSIYGYHKKVQDGSRPPFLLLFSPEKLTNDGLSTPEKNQFFFVQRLLYFCCICCVSILNRTLTLIGPFLDPFSLFFNSFWGFLSARLGLFWSFFGPFGLLQTFSILQTMVRTISNLPLFLPFSFLTRKTD